MPARVNSWLMPDAADPVREIAELRALLAEREAELAEARAELTGARLRIEQYKTQLAQLRRMQFGRSSEKLDARIAQLELMLEDLEEGEAARPAPAALRLADRPHRDRRQPVRRPLPVHLPREEIVHDPGSVCPGCGGTRFSKLGEDVTEVLEKIPARLKVIRHIRPKLSCRCCVSTPESSGGPGRRENLRAQRPRGGRFCCRPGKFFRRTGWRRRRRALGLKETCQGRACGKRRQEPGGISQRHLNPALRGALADVGLGLKTTLGCHGSRATGIKATGPLETGPAK